MLKNPKVTVRRNFVPQCECWDSVNLTQRGPWHPWEQVSKSAPAHCSTSFAFLTSRRKFWYTLPKHHLVHIHPWRNKTDQTNGLPLPSLPSDVPWAQLGMLSVSRSSCSALHCTPTKLMGLESSTSQVGSYSFWNQEPKSTSSGSPVRGKALLSKVTTPPLHRAMRKEVEKSELKQPDVSNSINVTVHSLITEMVSHCSGRLGKTNRPELGFGQTGQLSNTRDWVMMNGNYLIR